MSSKATSISVGIYYFWVYNAYRANIRFLIRYIEVIEFCILNAKNVWFRCIVDSVLFLEININHINIVSTK